MAKIKTTGAEIKKFWSCDDQQFWPDDSYVEDLVWTVNGQDALNIEVDKLEDSDVVVLEGYIFRANLEAGEKSIASVMKKWRQLQTHSTFAVEIPNDQKEALEAFLKTIKGKVV